MPPRKKKLSGSGTAPGAAAVAARVPALWPRFVADFAGLLSRHLPYHYRCFRYLSDATLAAEGMPNILLYGHPGFPKALMWRAALAARFGEAKERDLVFDKTIHYRETPYYISLDMSHPLTKDLHELPAFLKFIVSHQPIHPGRHIIVLENIDQVTERQPFRVLLERFSQNALFLCTTHRISALEGPLQSRFQHLRVPLPVKAEVASLLGELGGEPEQVSAAIAAQSRGDRVSLVAAFALLHDPVAMSVSAGPSSVETILTELAADSGSRPSLEAIRKAAFRSFQTNVPLAMFAERLMSSGCVPEERLPGFVEEAASLEHKLARTNRGRAPLYFELLLVKALRP